MKKNLFNISKALAMICCVIVIGVLPSCEKEGQTRPGKPKPPVDTPSTNCNLTGTVLDYTGELDGCGWMISADNGTIIEPYGIPSSFKLRNGMRIKFAYHQVETFASVCMNGVGGEIRCIEEIGVTPAPDCKPLDVVNDPILGGCFPPPLENVYIEGNCLKITKGFSGCDDNTDRFDLVWDGSYDGNNPAIVNLALMDRLANGAICDAYFVKTLSFDLSVLKKNNSGKIAINLPGWNNQIIY